ncbi:hypothetical protein PTTG_09584 [Puccinia triticina 1-1 BBBD Race 1]|uniref:Uncharacterized protein n=1 Tax=Puccinia triticina (isolate 1-1 / race 1 (BBBD)) TaxID=630390 RepID=A0A0C4F8T0_PUCT1|nr:hypothetical protein PTTG_09584 [Puccinia triticina 1-1 BBBD Race 1]
MIAVILRRTTCAMLFSPDPIQLFEATSAELLPLLEIHVWIPILLTLHLCLCFHVAGWLPCLLNFRHSLPCNLPNNRSFPLHLPTSPSSPSTGTPNHPGPPSLNASSTDLPACPGQLSEPVCNINHHLSLVQPSFSYTKPTSLNHQGPGRFLLW